jgi:hypothetical protein
MDSHPRQIAAAVLHLTGVESGSYFYTEQSHLVPDRTRALDGSGRTVEGCQKSVAGCVDLLATELLEVFSNNRRVSAELAEGTAISLSASPMRIPCGQPGRPPNQTLSSVGRHTAYGTVMS